MTIKFPSSPLRLSIQSPRIKLLKEVKELCLEIAILQVAQKPLEIEKIRVLKFWTGLFGFHSLSDMTNEDLKNFKELLSSRAKGLYSLKSLPGLNYG